MRLGWGIIGCCRAVHEGHRAPRQASPPQRRGSGRQVLALVARKAGASALSARLGRARLASTAPPAPDKPSKRARRPEPQRLASRRPGPTATWCSRPEVRAEPARRARRQQMTPPPFPTRDSHPGATGCFFFSISAATPLPLQLQPPPPLPTGQAAQAWHTSQAGVGAGAQRTADGAQHQCAPAAQCAVHSL